MRDLGVSRKLRAPIKRNRRKVEDHVGYLDGRRCFGWPNPPATMFSALPFSVRNREGREARIAAGLFHRERRTFANKRRVFEVHMAMLK